MNLFRVLDFLGLFGGLVLGYIVVRGVVNGNS